MFTEKRIRDLLTEVAHGELPVEEALSTLRRLPFEDVGDGTLDHHRQLRDGFGEVIYCEGKTPEQVARIAGRMAAASARLLGTRATIEQYESALEEVPDLQFHETARALWLDREPRQDPLVGTVVVSAGTSDLPIVEEAALILKLMGNQPQIIMDVGIAGVHRLLHHLDSLQSASVIIVVAGMEGALPSLVGGLVSAPVIGVPTSVGYGVSFHGVTAMLAMLSSCAPGVAVVNIDNGFGAGYLAAMINRKIQEARGQ